MAMDTRGRAAGVVGGAVAWVLGYVFTYLIVAPDVRNSLGSRVLEIFAGDPATLEIVGWVFYNAHLVQTVFSDILIPGSSSEAFIGGDPGFTPLLYAVPVALLLAAGLAAGRIQGTDEPGAGIVAGLAVVPAYFVLTLAGVFLFAIEIGGGTAGPDLITSVVVAGIAYPAIAGGLGGAIAGYTA